MKIIYYFSVLSPYTYLAGNRLEDVSAKYGARVEYKPVDIMSLFARTGGVPPKDRHPSRIEYRAQELRRHAKAQGMPFNLSPAHWPTNGAPASYAFVAAQNAGTGNLGALVHAITRCVWADEKDIAQDEVVRACLSEAGFDPNLAGENMLQSAETYTANLDEAVKAGVFGVPFYITEDDQRFWGQDRIDDLDRYLAAR